jgi:hypothetical protein
VSACVREDGGLSEGTEDRMRVRAERLRERERERERERDCSLSAQIKTTDHVEADPPALTLPPLSPSQRIACKDRLLRAILGDPKTHTHTHTHTCEHPPTHPPTHPHTHTHTHTHTYTHARTHAHTRTH